MTLTKLGETNVSIIQGRHYNADLRVSGLSIAKGDLLFVGIYRDGNTVTTNNVQFGWTLAGS